MNLGVVHAIKVELVKDAQILDEIGSEADALIV